MQQTIQIIVSGKVQGVFYRQSTKERAVAMGVSGEVKNLPDGRVKITATGTKEQLDQLIAWCRIGPAKAHVTDIEIKNSPLQFFERFSIARF